MNLEYLKPRFYSDNLGHPIKGSSITFQMHVFNALSFNDLVGINYRFNYNNLLCYFFRNFLKGSTILLGIHLSCCVIRPVVAES